MLSQILKLKLQNDFVHTTHEFMTQLLTSESVLDGQNTVFI